MTPIRVRPATLADAPRITEIYNQGIADRVATYETQPRTEEAVRGWFDTHYPLVVAERDDSVIAWAGTSSYRPRACYAGNAEFSVYVARDERGHGAGRIVMQALITAAQDAGLSKLVSRVFVENIASRKLLRSLGFREVGVYERHAQLDGVWRDVVIVERLLRDYGDEPYGALWQPDPTSLERWRALTPGSEVMIEKRPWESDKPPVFYRGTVKDSKIPAPWVEIQAEWQIGRVNVGGLVFEVGDELREFFSPRHPFNAFAIYSPEGNLRGWYGNVTKTTRLERHQNGIPMVVWQDLVLDLIMLPDGTTSNLDDDELDASGIADNEPDIAGQIITARHILRKHLKNGFFPTR